MSDNRFHDNNVSGALSQYGSLHPADGGGFVFVPNKEHSYLCTTRFENPDREKAIELLLENIKQQQR